jgi:hypothetical protein
MPFNTDVRPISHSGQRKVVPINGGCFVHWIGISSAELFDRFLNL